MWILYVQYKAQALNVFILLQVKEHLLSFIVLTALFMPKPKACPNNVMHMEIHMSRYVASTPVSNSPFHSPAYSNTRSSLQWFSHDFLILNHCIPSFFTPTILRNKKPYMLLQNLITTYMSMQINQWIWPRILIQPSMKSQPLKIITLHFVGLFLYIGGRCNTFCSASSVFSGFVLSAWEASFIGIGMNLKV